MEIPSVKVLLDGVGEVEVAISFGGSFFAIVPAEALGLRVERAYTRQLIDLGMKLRKVLNDQIKVQHPTLKHINPIDLVEIYDIPSHPEADLQCLHHGVQPVCDRPR